VVDLKKELAEIARILSEKPDAAAALVSTAQAMATIEYGEITIKMQAGKPVWVDSVKRERVG
jgi:hypothetical protein